MDHLNSWFLQNARNFPWRENRTPYRVWVSEVMLQQTRASVVASYFLKWMELFPDIYALASAPLELVIKAWEGLGYYSRARNLLEAAKWIVKERNGQIPSSKDELLKIKGFGPYTTAAVLSFAFQQKEIAVDGNVLRVIARFACIEKDIKKQSVKREIESIGLKLLDSQKPWITAEAFIELGATVCSPIPKCEICPLNKSCIAYAKQMHTFLPIKSGQIKIKKINRTVLIAESSASILIHKNQSGKLMADLWEFLYFEGNLTFKELQDHIQKLFGEKGVFISRLPKVKSSFTRFEAHLTPYHFQFLKKTPIDQYEWIEKEKLTHYPFSAGHRKILDFFTN